MTDITESEVKSELSFVRHSSILSPEVFETDEGVVLSCDVNDQNRFVFAEVFRALAEYVYSDSNETALERFCNIIDVRKLKIGLIEQGTRGKVARAVLSSGFQIDDNVFACVSLTDMEACESLLNEFETKCDVVVLTKANFEDNPLVPTRCCVLILVDGVKYEKHFDILGTKEDVADRLTFLTLATACKKIY